MGAQAARSSRRQPEPEINITPLVDVVLVLLIIFMVVAPQLEHGERVELPTVERPEAKSKSKLDPITVTMTSSGALFLEKERMSDKDMLKARLAEIRAAEPDRRVILKGDATVRYSLMREAFALCQGAGFSGVALAVSQRGDRAEPEEG